MVAGNTKRIIVIKNISSNLIEEAILILKNDPGMQEAQAQNSEAKPDKKRHVRNDFILKEAESIINQYIKENGLTVTQNRRRIKNKARYINISVNALINILFLAASAILIFVLSRML